MSELSWSSSGKGKKNRTMKCPKCKQEVTVYPDRSIERHKIYLVVKGKVIKSTYSWCTQKKLKG